MSVNHFGAGPAAAAPAFLLQLVLFNRPSPNRFGSEMNHRVPFPRRGIFGGRG